MHQERKLKVALLQSPTFPLNIEYHGGIERVELGQLEILNSMGHVAHLFVPKVIGKKINVFVLYNFGWKNRWLKWLYYLQFFFKALKYDICHGHYTPELLTIVPKKSVLYFHGLAVKELPLFRYNFFKQKYLKTHYTFCAKWVKSEFQKIYPEIHDTQLHVLHYGCNVQHFRPKSDVATERKGMKVCWYGLWEDEKGVFDLLEAFEAAKGLYPELSLSIGGSAEYEGKTKESAKIDKRVREWAARIGAATVGKIKYCDLPMFIGAHDIGIFPSKYRDPFPSVPLEMMACGLPVIAYDYGGPRECIVEGQTGFLVEHKNIGGLKDKIIWFAKNPDRIKEMGSAAREHMVRNFTWEKHAENLLKIYNIILVKK